MYNALGGSLINDADSVDISSVYRSLVAVFKSLIKALYSGLDSGRNYAIVEIFLSGHADALQSGLMVCQNGFPLVIFTRTSDIISRSFAVCKHISCLAHDFFANIVRRFPAYYIKSLF